MLPVILQSAGLSIGLIGTEEAKARRHAFLAEAGVMPVVIAPEAAKDHLKGLKVLFVAGLERDTSEPIAAAARSLGVLVNVEDMPDLCDFHVPASVRRGDLLITVSTGANAPGLSRILREWLEQKFGEVWGARLDGLRRCREDWRAEGHSPSEVSRLIRERVQQEGWLS